MSEVLKHLVIVDPTQDRHIALERALATNRVRNPRPMIRLFVAVDGETTDLRATNDKLYRDAAWFKTLTEPLDREGVEYSVELSWSDDWQGAVLHSCERFSPSHIFMPDYEKGRRRRFYSNQQWALLRRSRVPVTIVRPGESGPRKRILAAVNIQKEDDQRYAKLNEKILTYGKEIAELYGSDFFVVNAYPDSMHFPDRERLMKRAGLDTHHVHVEEGDPEDVIASYARQIGADAVVVGTLHRTGALALMKGNTSEKVLRKLDQDVITYS